MAAQISPGKRGRPLGFVSTRALEKFTPATPMTSAQLSTALQLSRRDAVVVCSKLADAGHLKVVARQGRANLYAAADRQPDPAADEAPWMMIVQALKP
jgi:hypothetical protein